MKWKRSSHTIRIDSPLGSGTTRLNALNAETSSFVEPPNEAQKTHRAACRKTGVAQNCLPPAIPISFHRDRGAPLHDGISRREWPPRNQVFRPDRSRPAVIRILASVYSNGCLDVWHVDAMNNSHRIQDNALSLARPRKKKAY